MSIVSISILTGITYVLIERLNSSNLPVTDGSRAKTAARQITKTYGPLISEATSPHPRIGRNIKMNMNREINR